jgi:hypothetical protein
MNERWTQVTRDQLAEVLETITSPTVAVIDAQTVVKLVGAGRPYSEVTKFAVVEVRLAYRYAEEVNGRRLREGKQPNFVPVKAAWGRRVKKTPLIAHNDGLYLDCMVLASEHYEYEHAGEGVCKEEVEPWLRGRSKSRQGLKKPVIVRRYCLESIQKLTVNGMTYVVK